MIQLADTQLGTATLSPSTPVVAGSFGTWTIVYTVGNYGIDSGGQVKIARRLVSDWGKPQFAEPAGEGYTTVVTSGAAKIRMSWQQRGYIRPENPRHRPRHLRRLARSRRHNYRRHGRHDARLLRSTGANLH